MKRLAMAAALLLICLGLSGCILKESRVGVGMPPGLLYKKVRGPATAPRGGPGIILPEGYKEGRATVHRVELGLPGLSQISPAFQAAEAAGVGWGDFAWETAMENGGLEEAYFSDYEELEILSGLYTRIELIVYGK